MTWCWRWRACWRGDGRLSPPSVQIEYRLVRGNLLADRVRFGFGRVMGIHRRRQAAKLHQTSHQQEAGLCGSQITSADQAIPSQREPGIVAAPHAHHRHAAVDRSQHQAVPRHRGHDAIGRKTFDDEAGQRRVPQIVFDARDKVDLAIKILF